MNNSVRRRMTEEDIKIILQLCAEGHSISEVSRRTGWSRAAIDNRVTPGRRENKVIYDKSRYAEHKTEVNARVNAHHEKVRGTLPGWLNRVFTTARGRANRSNREFSISVEDIQAVIPADNLCPVLGIPLVFTNRKRKPDSASIDRVNSELGYTPGNIRVISWKANNLKREGSLEFFKSLVNYIETFSPRA